MSTVVFNHDKSVEAFILARGGRIFFARKASENAKWTPFEQFCDGTYTQIATATTRPHSGTVHLFVINSDGHVGCVRQVTEGKWASDLAARNPLMDTTFKARSILPYYHNFSAVNPVAAFPMTRLRLLALNRYGRLFEKIPEPNFGAFATTSWMPVNDRAVQKLAVAGSNVDTVGDEYRSISAATNKDGVLLVYGSRVNPTTAANAGADDSIVEWRENAADYGWQAPVSGFGFGNYGWSETVILPWNEVRPYKRSYAKLAAHVMQDKRVVVVLSAKGGTVQSTLPNGTPIAVYSAEKGGTLYCIIQKGAGGGTIYDGYAVCGSEAKNAVGWSLQPLPDGNMLLTAATADGKTWQTMQTGQTNPGLFGPWNEVRVDANVLQTGPPQLPDIEMEFTLPDKNKEVILVDGTLLSGMYRTAEVSSTTTTDLEKQYALAKQDFYWSALGCIAASGAAIWKPSLLAATAVVAACGQYATNGEKVMDLKEKIRDAQLSPPPPTPPPPPPAPSQPVDPYHRIPQAPEPDPLPTTSSNTSQPGSIEGVDANPTTIAEVSVIA